jgi:phosphoglycolate/pyridoxal phosphate phosphatase family enzyme
MDGVVNLGELPIPGSADTIVRLQQAGKKIYFLTNNSSRSRGYYQQKLSRFGIDVKLEQIYTSAYLASIYLSGIKPGAKVFVVGEHGLADELAWAGLEPIVDVNTVPYTEIDTVVVGIDRSFTYDKLRFAHACVVHGHATLVATNRDATYPTETGEIPGGGSIVACVATACNREPITIGKPEPYSLEMILKESGSVKEELAMVGDRLDTDIAAGNRIGAQTVLVLTGVTTEEEAKNATDPLLKPTIIIGTLDEILKL